MRFSPKWLAALLAGGVAAIGACVPALIRLPWPERLALASGGVLLLLLLALLFRSRRQLVEAHAMLVSRTLYLANMTHELRTPLNAVLGFSEMLTDEILGPLGDPRYRGYAADIHASASHLLEVVNDVLEMARIEVGRLELTESVVELADVLATCERLVRERARLASVVLILELETGLPALRCDAVKLKQILLNLMTNAVKFTPAGGRVAVRGRHEGRGVALEVADTGPGIAPADIPRVFTPFMRAAQSHLNGVEGSGLGLPLAKRLAELHGASLTLHSRPGRGTRVVVRLPEDRCLHASPPAPVSERRAPVPA